MTDTPSDRFPISYLIRSPFSTEAEQDGNIVSRGGRKISTPLGGYQVDIYITASHTSERRPIRVTANSFDSDDDGISDAVEDENSGITGGPVTIISYQGNTFSFNRSINDHPPLISYGTAPGDSLYRNRGTHDYSLARGTITAGRLSNGLRIANGGTGYQYYRGEDISDTDNWAILELINLMERVARKWDLLYDYPLITSMDMSRQTGVYFPPHRGHRKGLEVDIRYIRVDNSAGPVWITDLTSYSRSRTQQLVDIFIEMAPFVTILSADTELEGTQYDADHYHHMHILIADPDGDN